MSFPDKKYNIIYADPPWSYHLYRPEYEAKYNSSGFTRTASSIYETMTTNDICNLPVKTIGSKNCALFLWVTSPLLPDGLKVIESWGFEFKTIGFVWVKTFPSYSPSSQSSVLAIGLGHYTRPSAEICLFALKGKLKRVNKSVKQVHIAPIRGHSRKPDLFRERIVKLFGDLPRIELFARQKVHGWDAWGNQIDEKQTTLTHSSFIY